MMESKFGPARGEPGPGAAVSSGGPRERDAEGAAIEFDGVSLSFNGKAVLHQLSFEISRADKVVVWGRSGLGKSSLFSLALGFVQPDRGRVLCGGVPLDENSVWQVRRKVAFIDQDVSIGPGRVSDWVAFAAGLRANAAADFSAGRVAEWMTFFELGRDILDKEVSDLSGGERQRMALVVAVLLGREIFFLDEVTSALDKHLKEKVADFFITRKEWTVVVISHDAVWLGHPAVKVFDLEAGTWKR